MYGNHYLMKRLFLLCFDCKCYYFQFAVMGGMMISSIVQGCIASSKAREAQERADEAFREIIQVANKKMSYAAELDTEWNDTFGGATAAAAKFYNEMTSANLKQQYELTGNQAQAQNLQNFQNQMKQLDTKINQMGMQNSSQALSALMQMSSQQMANNAAINFETQMNIMRADEEVAQKQAAWSAQGNTLKNAAIQTKNEAYNLQAQAWQAKAGNEQAQAINYQNQSQAHINNAMSIAGDMASLGAQNLASAKAGQLATNQSNLNQSLAALDSDWGATQAQMKASGITTSSSQWAQAEQSYYANRSNLLTAGLNGSTTTNPTWKQKTKAFFTGSYS